MPDSFEVTRSLLLYGLSKTDFSQLAELQGEREEGREGLLSLEEEQEENRDEDNSEEIRRRIQSWGSLCEEQKFLSQCRLRLLEMLDRLSCYEVSRWWHRNHMVVLKCSVAIVVSAKVYGVVMQVLLSLSLSLSVCVCVCCSSSQRILGGPRYVDNRYRSEEFRWFRDENVVQLATNYARVSRRL